MRKREVALAGEVGASVVKDEQFVTALARGLEVLRAFRPDDPRLGNQELARRTGLPKPTVSRLTYTLASLGYLSYDRDTASYRLSIKALSLGFSALGRFAIRDVARPYMQKLADETGVSVALGARDGAGMIYIEHCRGDSPLHIGIEVGSHISIATSAMGRAYLVALPSSERMLLLDILAQKGGRGSLRKSIEAAQSDYDAHGFVLSLGDWKQGVNAVGVPLVLGSGPLSFALNCGGPAGLLPSELLRGGVGPKLVAIAAAIRKDMDVQGA